MIHAGTSGGSEEIEGRLPGGEHVDLAPLEHGRGEAAHGRSRLQMKVPEHGPTLPPTKEAGINDAKIGRASFIPNSE